MTHHKRAEAVALLSKGLSRSDIASHLGVAASTITRWLTREGVPLERSSKSATLQERLDRYTDKSAGPKGCWEWTASKHPKGYGYLCVGKTKHRYAHTVALELKIGRTLGEGMTEVARHTCDNPSCVNPAHLVPGTCQDNTDDMVARGRQRKHTVCTPETIAKVVEMCNRGMSQRAVSRETGLSRCTVRKCIELAK